MEHVMHEKLAGTLRIEISGWRTVLSLDNEASHHALYDAISNEKLRNDLDPPRFEPAVFGYAPQKRLGHEHDDCA